MTDHATLRQLSLVDWDFIERTDHELSAIHWYPGSFAPGLPGVFIDLLMESGDTVFDPFCGVGTTAVAAILRGRNSVSYDVSLVGSVAGLATTGLIALLLKEPILFHESFDNLEAIVDGVDRQFGFLSNSLNASLAVDGLIESYSGASLRTLFAHLFQQPSLSCLIIWYHPKTLEEIMRLLADVESAPIPDFCKLVGFTMISAIARAVSSETRSWGHIADNVKPKEFVYKDIKFAAKSWLRRTKKQILTARTSSAARSWLPKFEFHLADWLVDRPKTFSPAPSLLLTSPPYGGAIDYGLAQRLSLYLLGLTDEKIAASVNLEIGARRKRFKSDHVSTWADELSKAVSAQISYLRSDGHAVFVMPHKDHGRGAGEISLGEVLKAKGWDLWFSSDRSVRQSRTRQSWTSIKKETILVYKKGR